MLERLEQIRLEKSRNREFGSDYASCDRAYAQAFREYGIDLESLEVEAAAQRIAARVIHCELAAALDDWSDVKRVLRQDEIGWKKLSDIAGRADPDLLRDRLRSLWREPVTKNTDRTLAALAEPERVRAMSPTTLLLLANVLRKAVQSSEEIRVLREGQREHPADFWINFKLAFRLSRGAPRSWAKPSASTPLQQQFARISALYATTGCCPSRSGPT